MKNLIAIMFMSLFVFALKAQKIDSMTIVLESRYTEYNKLSNEIANFRCCSCSSEVSNKWLEEHYNVIIALEEEIIKMEKELNLISIQNNPPQLNKKTFKPYTINQTPYTK